MELIWPTQFQQRGRLKMVDLGILDILDIRFDFERGVWSQLRHVL